MSDKLLDSLQTLKLLPDSVQVKDLRVGVITDKAALMLGGTQLATEEKQTEFMRRLNHAFRYYVTSLQEQVASELSRPSVASNLYNILSREEQS